MAYLLWKPFVSNWFWLEMDWLKKNKAVKNQVQIVRTDGRRNTWWMDCQALLVLEIRGFWWSPVNCTETAIIAQIANLAISTLPKNDHQNPLNAQFSDTIVGGPGHVVGLCLCGWADVGVARDTWMIKLNMAPYNFDGSKIRRLHQLNLALFFYTSSFLHSKSVDTAGMCFTEQPSTTPFIQFQVWKKHCGEVWFFALKCTCQTCVQHRICKTFQKTTRTSLNKTNPLWVPVNFGCLKTRSLQPHLNPTFSAKGPLCQPRSARHTEVNVTRGSVEVLHLPK